jgi:hypothetical protein
MDTIRQNVLSGMIDNIMFSNKKEKFNSTLQKTLIQGYKTYKSIPFQQNINNDQSQVVEIIMVFLYTALYESGHLGTRGVHQTQLVDLANGSFCSNKYIDYCLVIKNMYETENDILKWTHLILYLVYNLQMKRLPVVINNSLKRKIIDDVSDSFIANAIQLLYLVLLYRLVNIKHNLKLNNFNTFEAEYAIFLVLISFYNSYSNALQNTLISGVQKDKRMWSYLNLFVHSQILDKNGYFKHVNAMLNVKESTWISLWNRPLQSVSNTVSNYFYPLEIQHFFTFDNMYNAYKCLTTTFIESHADKIVTNYSSPVSIQFLCFKDLGLSIWKNSVKNYIQNDNKIVVGSNVLFDTIIASVIYSGTSLQSLYTNSFFSSLSFVDFNYFIGFMVSLQFIYLSYFVLTNNNMKFGVHTFNFKQDVSNVSNLFSASFFQRIRNLIFSAGNPIESIKVIDSSEPTQPPFVAWVNNKNNMNSNEYSSSFVKVIPLPKTNIVYGASNVDSNLQYGGENVQKSLIQDLFEESIKNKVVDKNLPKLFQQLANDTIKNKIKYNKIIDDFKKGYIITELPLHQQIFIKKAFKLKSNKIGGGRSGFIGGGQPEITLPGFDSEIYSITLVDKACTPATLEETIHNNGSVTYSIIEPFTDLEVESQEAPRINSSLLDTVEYDFDINYDIEKELKFKCQYK